MTIKKIYVDEIEKIKNEIEIKMRGKKKKEGWIERKEEEEEEPNFIKNRL